MLTLFEGITLKNELYSYDSGKYRGEIIAELQVLVKEVEVFLDGEMHERVKGGMDVARRMGKYVKTNEMLEQVLGGAKHEHWIKDNPAVKMGIFLDVLIVVIGNNFEYWHDPVIIARRRSRWVLMVVYDSRFKKWIAAKETHHKECYKLQGKCRDLERTIVEKLKQLVIKYALDLPATDEFQKIRLIHHMKSAHTPLPPPISLLTFL